VISEIDRELETRLRAAFVRADEPDWSGVRKPSRGRSPRRMSAFALAGLIAVLAFGSQAFGVGPQLASLFDSKPPPPVKRAFSGGGFLRGIDKSSISLVAAARTRDGRSLRLWRARKSGGQACELITIAGHATAIGCGPARPGTIGVLLETSDIKPHLIQASAFIAGIAPPGTRRVRLIFEDGTRRDVVTRIGAWLTEIPWAQRRYGHSLVRVQTIDASGAVSHSVPMRPARRPAQPAGRLRVVARLAGRPLKVASARGGGSCLEFKRGDGIGVSSCGKAANHPAGWLVRVAPPGVLGELVLLGRVTKNATQVTIERERAPALEAPIHDGIFAIVLPQTAQHRPLRIVESDAHGGARVVLNIGTPKAGVYARAWHGALYTKITLGHMNSLGYTVGPLIWPDGHITPRRQAP
jgi:hypothetical protein